MYILPTSSQLYPVVVFVVLLAALSWLFIGILHNGIDIWLRVVMIFVGLLVLLLLPNRDIYMPFLGEASLYIPPATIPPSGNVLVELTSLPPSIKVLYWVGEDGGVVMTDKSGTAKLQLLCPKSVIGPNRFGIDRVLPKRVYFRYELRKGVFSRVESKELDLCAQ
jgi:hypothetical protein